MTETETPAQHWENQYADNPRRWSGRVNPTTADVAKTLPPGTALDLGCGEGGDAVWLAEQGWQVVAVDISASETRSPGSTMTCQRGPPSRPSTW